MKALTNASKKAKGTRLEKKFAQMLREKGLDKQATRMVLSGAAWGFKTDIKTHLPYSFECKNQEKVKIWEWWDQAREASTVQKPPVLVFSGNYRPILVCLDANDFLDLLAQLHQE